MVHLLILSLLRDESPDSLLRLAAVDSAVLLRVLLAVLVVVMVLAMVRVCLLPEVGLLLRL